MISTHASVSLKLIFLCIVYNYQSTRTLNGVKENDTTCVRDGKTQTNDECVRIKKIILSDESGK